MEMLRVPRKEQLNQFHSHFTVCFYRRRLFHRRRFFIPHRKHKSSPRRENHPRIDGSTGSYPQQLDRPRPSRRWRRIDRVIQRLARRWPRRPWPPPGGQIRGAEDRLIGLIGRRGRKRPRGRGSGQSSHRCHFARRKRYARDEWVINAAAKLIYYELINENNEWVFRELSYVRYLIIRRRRRRR